MSPVIVWRYLRDLTFSRFDTIQLVCQIHAQSHTHRDRQTHDDAYTALNIASRGKNRKIAISLQLFGQF